MTEPRNPEGDQPPEFQTPEFQGSEFQRPDFPPAAPDFPPSAPDFPPAAPDFPPATDPVTAPAPGPDDPVTGRPYEPAESLPSTRIESVAVANTLSGSAPSTTPPSRGRSGLRWVIALAALAIVVAVSIAIVSLASGSPTASVALGYMPSSVVQYTEVRLDLPGDQRTKLAGFLSALPGFKDQTAVEPKLNDLLDRFVRLATQDKQTYTADIQPWFSGQIGVGLGTPKPAQTITGGPSVMTPMLSTGADTVIVMSVSDPAKAAAWLKKTVPTGLTETTYNGVVLYTFGSRADAAVAITDKAFLAGPTAAVKAAVDTKGQGKYADDADFKTAFAEADRDYVALTFQKTRAYIQGTMSLFGTYANGALDKTQIDETVVGMLPAWQMATWRFESDALTAASVQPQFTIGYQATNRKSAIVGHLPASTLFYAESHDVGPALKAVIDKFRALPETADGFKQFDNALRLVGGFDATIGWWGDVALAVTRGSDGVIGGGLVVQARDRAAANRILTMLRGLLDLGGSLGGISARDVDHNGTKITILDFSQAAGMQAANLPPGYKAEFAWAIRDDIVALGYGSNFVSAILDAGPGSSLADNARYKALVARVGEENIGSSFVDLDGIRVGLEPIVKDAAKPDQWSMYEANIKPYLEHFDAAGAAIRTDGKLDRSGLIITMH